jgi:SAM-dependent methyltransferase
MLRTIKSGIEKLEETFWDSILGINTRGIKEERPVGSTYGDANWYQPKCYYLLWRYLRPLEMTSNDVFYDIGSGSGRLLCVTSLRRIRKCIGIELSASLCDIAKRNARALRFRHAPIEIRREDATVADYSSGTVFHLFNPFGAVTMKVVLDSICKSLEQYPRRVRFVYINPTVQQVFDEAGWLDLIANRSFAGSPLRACYYENRA